mgnify:CR=1 FL=1
MPLIKAAENGHIHIIRYLISIGEDPHAQYGLAIIMAEDNRHKSIVKYLKSFDG